MKLTVLGGFLGSGKTTWLRHQLHAGVFRDAFIVVNEAAEMPVDDALLGRSSRMAVLAGGCACCTAREDMIALLRRLADERSRMASTDDRLQEIVLETSGLADPGAIVQTIHSDPVLVHHLVVRETVVAVDALHALDHLRRDPLGRSQIEVADRLIITKVDESGPGALATLAATLRRINPGAAISGSARGSEAALPSFEDAARRPAARRRRRRRRRPVSGQACHRRGYRLDGLQRLALGAPPCPRRRCAAGERRGQDAGRQAAAAERAKDGAVARDPARAARTGGQCGRRHRPRLPRRGSQAIARLFRRSPISGLKLRTEKRNSCPGRLRCWNTGAPRSARPNVGGPGHGGKNAG